MRHVHAVFNFKNSVGICSAVSRYSRIVYSLSDYARARTRADALLPTCMRLFPARTEVTQAQQYVHVSEYPRIIKMWLREAYAGNCSAVHCISESDAFRKRRTT
jgi:hypothetical protein